MFRKIHKIYKEISPYQTMFAFIISGLGGIIAFFSPIIKTLGIPFTLLIGISLGIFLYACGLLALKNKRIDNINKKSSNFKISYQTTKLDIVFNLQPNYSQSYSKTMRIDVENEENIKSQSGSLYRPFNKDENNILAIMFIEFEQPLETISINAYELHATERNKGHIEVLYCKYCTFENKNFITACCIALHKIEETRNSSFRIQFLPSK